MNENINKSTVISSLFWKTLERGGAQGIQFIVQIILARLLLPADYGLIALIAIFIAVANVFVQSGFNTALIQKKEVDAIDLSSVFYASLVVSLILYMILFFTAPAIATFYNQPQLVNILRILSITLFFGAFNSIQNAYIARNMMFKKLFYSSFSATIISGIIGIVLAYRGFGVWALVAQQLISQIMVSIILSFIVKWRPQLLFSFDRLKKLFSYGSKLLISNLLDTLYNNISGLIIGAWYDSAMLGFYNRGRQFPELIVNNVNGSIQSVIFPALSSHQDDKKKIKQIMRRAIQTSSFIVFPMMVGLAATAEPIIKLLLTETWLPAVPFLQIFCISFALWPIHTANLQAINAIGRSDIFLKLEIIKKIIGVIIILFFIPFGALGMAWGIVISGIISTAINASPNDKLLDYKYLEQIKDMLPNLMISLIMGCIVYALNWLNTSIIMILISQIIIGTIIYIFLAIIFKVESANYLQKTIKEFMKSKKIKKYN